MPFDLKKLLAAQTAPEKKDASVVSIKQLIEKRREEAKKGLAPSLEEIIEQRRAERVKMLDEKKKAADADAKPSA